jgi:bacillithiol system protein YtxJ
MDFHSLETSEQLSTITAAEGYSLILKHNTSCPISRGVLARLQSEGKKGDNLPAVHVLDLHAHRDLSDAIAGQYGVPHQSPQVLLIRNGKCVYHEWGYDISAEAVEERMED